jgi:hypothetical protein
LKLGFQPEAWKFGDLALIMKAFMERRPHKVTGHYLSRLVHTLPRRDVVGDTGDDVAVGLHLPHIDDHDGRTNGDLALASRALGRTKLPVWPVAVPEHP